MTLQQNIKHYKNDHIQCTAAVHDDVGTHVCPCMNEAVRMEPEERPWLPHSPAL